MTRRGFTLIEMLVVVSIISLLVALLLPALKTAREVARAAVCGSQERQVGVAVSNYLSNSNGAYPYAFPATTYKSWSAHPDFPNWHMAIAPYLGGYTRAHQPEVLFCPSNPWPPYGPSYTNKPPSTYGLGPAFPSNWHDQSGASVFDPSKYIYAVRVHDVKRPSDVLLAGEVPNGGPPSENPYNRNFESRSCSEVPFRLWDLTYQLYWFTESIAGHPTSGGSPIAMTIHHEAWNSLMADGHVEATKKQKLAEMARPVEQGKTGVEGTIYWRNK